MRIGQSPFPPGLVIPGVLATVGLVLAAAVLRFEDRLEPPILVNLLSSVSGFLLGIPLVFGVFYLIARVYRRRIDTASARTNKALQAIEKAVTSEADSAEPPQQLAIVLDLVHKISKDLDEIKRDGKKAAKLYFIGGLAAGVPCGIFVNWLSSVIGITD